MYERRDDHQIIETMEVLRNTNLSRKRYRDTKRSSLNPICKHDTKDGWGHSKTAMEFPRTSYGRETVKACKRSEQCKNLEGRSDIGNNNRAR